MKKHTIFTIIFIIGFLFLVPLSFAVASNHNRGGGGGGSGCTTETGLRQYNFKCVAGFVGDMINTLVLLLIGIALLVFIWGLLKYIMAGGDEEKTKEAKRFIVFGFIAFFVMFSVWGLTEVLVRVFFPNGPLAIPQLK